MQMNCILQGVTRHHVFMSIKLIHLFISIITYFNKYIQYLFVKFLRDAWGQLL